MTYVIDKLKRNKTEYVFGAQWGGGGWEAPTLKAVVYWTGKDWSCVITEDTVMEAKEYEFCDFIICAWKTVSFYGNWPAMFKVCNIFCNMWTIDLRSKNTIPGCSKSYYMFWEVANVASKKGWDISCEAYWWRWGINNRWSSSDYFRWWDGWGQSQNWYEAPGDWYCDCCSACMHAVWWPTNEWAGWWWGWGSWITYWAGNWYAGNENCWWAGWMWSSTSPSIFQTWWGWWGWGWFWVTRWGTWGRWGSWICKGWNGWMWWGTITWTGWTGWQGWDWYCATNITGNWYPWDWGKGWFSLCWTWGTWWVAWLWFRNQINYWWEWWDSVYWTWGTWGNWAYAYWCTWTWQQRSYWGKWGTSIFGNWGNGWLGWCWACENNTNMNVDWGYGWTWWDSFYWKAGNGWKWGDTINTGRQWWAGWKWGDAVWWQYWLLIIANQWTNNKICGKGGCWWTWWAGWCSPTTNAACLWWWVGWNWGDGWDGANVTIFYNNTFSQWSIDIAWWAWGAGWAWWKNACNCASASWTAWTSWSNWILTITQMAV